MDKGYKFKEVKVLVFVVLYMLVVYYMQCFVQCKILVGMNLQAVCKKMYMACCVFLFV